MFIDWIPARLVTVNDRYLQNKKKVTKNFGESNTRSTQTECRFSV
jgi:hypothetical protein